MEVYIQKQIIIVGYSVILGLIFGALYDIIRVIHILCGIASYSGEKKGMERGKVPFILFFLTDSVYMLFVTLLFSFFVYWINSGVVRFFILFSVIVGFLLYILTVGRVVMVFSEAIVKWIKMIIRYTVFIPAAFVCKIIKCVVLFVYRHTVVKLFQFLRRVRLERRTERYRKLLKRDTCVWKMDGEGIHINE